MDALVDLEIAELEILMEQQNIPPEAGPYGGEGIFTPELFLSHGVPDAYTNNFDAFEEAWLELQTTTNSGDAITAIDKPVFTEGDDPEDVIIVTGSVNPYVGVGSGGFVNGSVGVTLAAQVAGDGDGTEDEIIVTGQQISPADGDGIAFVSHSDGTIGIYAYFFDVFGHPSNDDGADFETAEDQVADFLFIRHNTEFTVEWDEVNGVFIVQGTAF